MVNVGNRLRSGVWTRVAFSYAYDALGITLNARKTRVLLQPSPDHKHGQKQLVITVGDQWLSSVDHFTYFGSCLSSKADVDVETQFRLKSASAAFGRLLRMFHNRTIYTSTKIKVYKAIILPTLPWEMRDAMPCHERCHQRCLRRNLNIMWQSRQTNIGVLEEANATSIESYIIKNQLRWAGHLVRMSSYWLPKILCDKLTIGSRQGNENVLRIVLNTTWSSGAYPRELEAIGQGPA